MAVDSHPQAMANLGSKVPKALLVSVPQFLPGFKGGGAIRAVSSLLEMLGPWVRIRLMTSHCDLGSRIPYDEDAQTAVAEAIPAEILYLPSTLKGARQIFKCLRTEGTDLVYLNSVFSPVFTLWPLLLRRLGLLPSGLWMLAPRGELLAGALSKKPIRKQVFLRLAQVSGLLRDVLFHATSELEVEAISRWFGPAGQILLAPDVPPAPSAIPFGSTVSKTSGVVKLVYLGRIDSPKNLGYLMERLGQLKGEIELRIIGPVVDQDYANMCINLAQRLPANCQVFWLGPLEHAQALAALRENHLLVIPSLSENYGFVIIEALLSGCPVLATDQTPWTEELVHPGGTAIALESEAEFEAYLQTWIDLDQMDSDRRRQAARRLGEQHVQRVVPQVLATWLQGPLSSGRDLG